MKAQMLVVEGVDPLQRRLPLCRAKEQKYAAMQEVEVLCWKP